MKRVIPLGLDTRPRAMPLQDIARVLPSRPACPTNTRSETALFEASHHKAGLRTKEKAPPRRMTGPACLVTRGTAYLLVGQGSRDFFRLAQGKSSLPVQSNEKAPAQRGRVVVSVAVRKEAAAASRQASGHGCPGEQRKGPAADGASFLPRPQILDCGSAATFRLQIQPGSAGIVPTETRRSGAK